jgi:DNA-binding Lrp family transcriptional regulator
VPHVPALDPVDLALVTALAADGRATNVALARAAGIAESTCIGRVRSLQQRGIIRGFRAELDLAELGLPIEAMVAVRLAGTDRRQVDEFGEHVCSLPGVLAAYNVSGADDFLVHLVAESPDGLRGVVLDHLSGHPGVVHVQTSLIFRTHSGRRVLPRPG